MARKSAVAGAMTIRYCFAGKPDMADLRLVLEIEQLRESGFLGQNRRRKRRHEMLGAVRQDTPDLRAAFLRATDKIQGFIGGDASANDKKDGFSLHSTGSQAVASYRNSNALVIIARTATCEQKSAMHSGAPLQRENDVTALPRQGVPLFEQEIIIRAVLPRLCRRHACKRLCSALYKPHLTRGILSRWAVRGPFWHPVMARPLTPAEA